MTDPRTRFPDVAMTEAEAESIQALEAQHGALTQPEAVRLLALFLRLPPELRPDALRMMKQEFDG